MATTTTTTETEPAPRTTEVDTTLTGDDVPSALQKSSTSKSSTLQSSTSPHPDLTTTSTKLHEFPPETITTAEPQSTTEADLPEETNPDLYTEGPDVKHKGELKSSTSSDVELSSTPTSTRIQTKQPTSSSPHPSSTTPDVENVTEDVRLNTTETVTTETVTETKRNFINDKLEHIIAQLAQIRKELKMCADKNVTISTLEAYVRNFHVAYSK